jgi:4-amino-4-deoxy-L-arabinose transferase-like glycosyltransferase
LGVLSFFSFSSSKLIPYILPILPPLALVTGIALTESLYLGTKDFQRGVWTNGMLFLAAFIAYFFAKSEIEEVLRNPGATLLITVSAGLLILAEGILIFSLYFKVSKTATVFAYIFIGANIMWIFNKASVLYQEVKKPTTKQMAETINLNKREEDLVFCYKRYYQDFPVYLNSTVGVVDFVGELQFGANADPNNDKLIIENKFWELWNTTNKRIFLLLSRKHYREIFAMKNPIHRILDFDKYFAVITNR